MRDWPGQIDLWILRGDLPGWLQADLYLLARDYEKAELAKDLNATLAIEEPLRELRDLTIQTLGKGKRWPCKFCGREHAGAPLRSLEVRTEDGHLDQVGCWMCITGDRLVAKAEGAFDG
jgi:hypothetical protein